MKKFIICFIFIVSSLHASIFSDAIKAFQSKDYDKAYSLFHRSLNNQSSIQANYFLGVMHLRGLGTPQNLNLAQRHLTIASNIGNARAKCLLAQIHILQKERTKAIEILSQSDLRNIIECEQIIQTHKLEIKAEK